jgi:hypothetical protein
MKIINFLAKKPNIYIDKNEKFQNKPTLILSIFSIISVLVISFFFIIDFLNFKNINVYSSQTTKILPIGNLTDSNIMIRFNDVYGNIYNETYTNFVIQKWSFMPENKGKPVITNIPLEKCERTKHFINSTLLYENIPVEQYYCIKKESLNITIFGKAQDSVNPNTYIMIYLVKCLDNSPYNFNKIKCENETIINTKINKLPHFITFSYLDNEIDHSNKTNPFSNYLKSFTLPVGLNLIYRHLIYLKNVLYKSDNGIVFEDNELYEFSQYSHVNSEVYMNPFTIPGSFGAICISMSEVSNTHKREFEKLQTLFAKI